MKKTLAIILSLVMLMSAFSIMATATDGTVTTNAIEIDSAEDFANIPTTGLDKDYILTADITVTDDTYTPIGDYTNRFKGTFDGNGKTITVDITYVNTDIAKINSVADAAYVGLFGCVEGATIKNLTVKGTMDVKTSSSGIGAIIGGTFGNNTVENVVSAVDSTINVVASTNEAAASTKNITAHIGGIIGMVRPTGTTAEKVTLTDVSNKGDINITNEVDTATAVNTSNDSTFCGNAQGGIGGIVGFGGEYVTIELTRCVNYGDIEIDVARQNIAGILGSQAYTSTAGKGLVMSYCANHGDLTRVDWVAERMSGLFGGARVGVRINNCMNTGVLYDEGIDTHFVGFLGTGDTGNYAANSFTTTAVSLYFQRYNGSWANQSLCVNNYSVSDTKTLGCATALSANSSAPIDVIYEALCEAYADNDMLENIKLGVVDGKTDIYFAFENPEAYVAPAIEIDTDEEFAKIGVDAEYPLDGKYVLTENISITSDNYAPIGTYAAPFTGYFDGNGKTVTVDITYTNLDSTNTVAGCANVGLFGCIKDSTITGLTVSGTMDVTTICGYIGGIVGASYGNSALTECVSDVDMKITLDALANESLENAYQYPSFIGGMIGAFHQDQTVSAYSVASIIDCVNRGNMDIDTGITVATAPSGEKSYQLSTKGGYGGLVGVIGVNLAYTYGVQLTMTNCINYGDMDVNQGPQNIGGLYGMTACVVTAKPKVTMSYCANYGDLNRDVKYTDRVCGLFGYTVFADVNYCFNAGKLTDNGATAESIIGFIGKNGNVNANYCFTTQPTPYFYSNEARATDTTTNYPLSGMNGLNGSTAISASTTDTQLAIVNALIAEFAKDTTTSELFKAYGIYDTVKDTGINIGFTAPTGVSFYGYQTTDATEGENGTYNIRFVSLVDSLAYDKIGYDIKGTYYDAAKGKNVTLSWNKECAVVYTALTGSVDGTEAVYNVVGDYYIMALAITGVPTNVGEITFEVTPYSIDNEVKTSGEAKTIVYTPVTSSATE